MGPDQPPDLPSAKLAYSLFETRPVYRGAGVFSLRDPTGPIPCSDVNSRLCYFWQAPRASGANLWRPLARSGIHGQLAYSLFETRPATRRGGRRIPPGTRPTPPLPRWRAHPLAALSSTACRVGWSLSGPAPHGQRRSAREFSFELRLALTICCFAPAGPALLLALRLYCPPLRLQAAQEKHLAQRGHDVAGQSSNCT